MNDRDLTVLILAAIVAVVVGAIETVVTFTPDTSDGVLNSAFAFAVAWGFYRIGKS